MIGRYRPYIGQEEFKSLFNFEDDTVEKFEEEFSKLVGAKYGVSFRYGRSGLYALLKSEGISNSEILMPSYTCIVVPNAVVHSGNIPRFLNISLNDYNIDLAKIENKISKKTKVIIPTHMYGYPMDVKTLKEITGEEILIVEDCALAILSKYKGKKVGTIGDAAFYSFNVTKQITTFDGGIVTANNEEIYERLKKYRDSNFKKSSFSTGPKIAMMLLSSYFIFDRKIYGLIYAIWKHSNLLRKYTKNWNLGDIDMPNDFLGLYSEIQAKIGIEQIKKARKIIEKREKIAEIYDKELKHLLGVACPPIMKGATYSHYTTRVKNRDEFVEKMKNKGIEVGKTFDYSIPYTPAYIKYRNKDKFSNSLIAANEIVNLPNYPSLNRDDVKYICECIKEISVQ